MALSPFQQHVLLWLFLHQLWSLYKIKQSYWRYERTLLDMFSSKERVGKERDSQRKRGVTVLSHRKLNLQPPTQSLSQFRTWHALSMYITPCVVRYLRNNKISNKPLRIRSFLVFNTLPRVDWYHQSKFRFQSSINLTNKNHKHDRVNLINLS